MMHTSAAQVATYHYDIKRMDDTAASASDGLQASLLHGKGSSRSLLCFALTSPFPIPTPLQVTMADQTLDQAEPSSSSPAAPSVKTFKVFLVQVRGLGGTQPVCAAVHMLTPPGALLPCLPQELCTCSLRAALDRGALAREPQVRRLQPPCAPRSCACCRLRFLPCSTLGVALVFVVLADDCRALSCHCSTKWLRASSTSTARASSMEVSHLHARVSRRRRGCAQATAPPLRATADAQT